MADGLSRQYQNEEIEIEPERLKIDLNLNYLDQVQSLRASRARLMLQCARVEEETRIASSILDKLRELQSNDEQCREVMRNEALDKSELRVEKGLVLNGDKYLVPENREFQNELLKLYHDNSGHFGVQKTYELVNRLFTWKKLYDDVQLYVKQCTQCQRNKPSNKKPQGLLVPLVVPNQV